jgi:hypothetical protein
VECLESETAKRGKSSVVPDFSAAATLAGSTELSFLQALLKKFSTEM